jgi:hypothetical protein
MWHAQRSPPQSAAPGITRPGPLQFAQNLSPYLHRPRRTPPWLIVLPPAGRATSMNLIGSLCEHYNPEEVVERGFVDEVLRSGDGDVSVRAEGAVALSCIAKVAPVEHVYRMVSLL